MDIIFSHVVSLPQTVKLKYLIQDHHSQFKNPFPGRNMLNKHHHNDQLYGLCMRMCGPLVLYQCLRFEMKNNLAKRLAAVNLTSRTFQKVSL